MTTMIKDDKKQKILLVEDDRELAHLTAQYLSKNGYQIDVVDNGDDAVSTIKQQHPDLVILDVMIPGRDGLDVCREVRGYYQNPIVMLTARSDDIDQIVGLELGADDYICKPVSPRLLLARVKALLRRPRSENTISTAINSARNRPRNTLTVADLTIDNNQRSVLLNDVEIHLSTPEYDMLWFLASHAGQVLSRAEIFSEVRGFPYDGVSRFVDITISYLRSKLGDDPIKPQRIKTVRSKGYLYTSP